MVPEGQSLTQPVMIPGGQSCPHPSPPPPPQCPGGEFRARLVVSGQGIPAGFTGGHPTVEEALQTVKGCKSLERSFRASC